MTAALSHRESDGNYCRVVVNLNSRWRVIECVDRLQWILQQRRGERRGQPRFDGRSYCRTREALIRTCRAHAGEVEPAVRAILDLLPDWIGGRP